MRAIRGLLCFVGLPAAVLWVTLSVDLPHRLGAEAYTDGVTPLFLDRPYVNRESNPGLAGHRVVQLPRHLRFDVELRVSAPARLVRFLSDENDNRVFADWEAAEALRVKVPGRCWLTHAVTRHTEPGLIRLPAGGPCSSSPLLVETAGEISAQTVRSWNKLRPLGEGGWGGFVEGNSLTLAALALTYLAYCWIVSRLLRAWDAAGARSRPPHKSELGSQ